MSKGYFDYLKSKQCICGMIFDRGEDKSRHSKKCSKYQDLINEYLTFDKLNQYLNVERHNKCDLFKLYPYNMICLSDYVKFFKDFKCNSYIKVNDGSMLTLEEIKSILNKDYLYQKYVVDEMDTIDICHELNDKFTPQTVLEWMKKLGIPKRKTSDVTKKCLNKMQNTCIQKYGVKNVSVLDNIKDQKKETTLKNFGVEYHLQLKENIIKMQNNIQNKYGKGIKNASSIPGVQQRKNETCLKNNGVDNIFKDTDYIKQCYIEKFGVDNPSKLLEVKIKKFNSTKQTIDNGVFYSKISVELFNNISQRFPESISSLFHYATHNGEEFVVFNDSFYSIDFSYVKDNVKIAIEFNGDLWHANPNKYKEDETPLKPFDVDLTCNEIWKKDKKKIDDLNNNGFKTLVVWESDYESNKQNVLDECCNFIKQSINI